MRFKQIPEDFIVEEIITEDSPGEGYVLYRLTKTDLTTMDAMRYVVEKNGLLWTDVAWAGLKDKRGQTTQHVTIAQDIGDHWEREGILLEKIGTRGEPLKQGALSANRFTCVLRDLDEKEIQTVNERVRSPIIIPNYFDDQRFGSFREGKWFGKELIKGNFEEALRLYLVTRGREGVTLEDVPASDWETKKILSHLEKHEGDSLGALRCIEKKKRRLLLLAYQSHLFNRMVDRFVRRRAHTEIDHVTGKLAIPDGWKLEEMSVPLLHAKAVLSSPWDAIAEEVLNEEEFSALTDLKTPRKMSEIFLGKGERPLTIQAQDVSLGEERDDELNSGKKKVRFSFTLRKGSYATLILKVMGGSVDSP